MGFLDVFNVVKTMILLTNNEFNIIAFQMHLCNALVPYNLYASVMPIFKQVYRTRLLCGGCIM